MKRYSAMLGAAALLLGACGHDSEPAAQPQPGSAVTGEELTMVAVPRDAFMRVAGTAAPIRQATLSTKLMGTVTAVDVREGEVVRNGQTLLRIDARDLAARSNQLEAALTEAEAVRAEAELNANRMRALYADDAAPRAQLDAAETGLTRARAGVEAVRANALELAAAQEYSVIRAPFAGMIVSRMVDPGSFAAPGAPLLVIQDVSALRITATAAPEAVRGLVRGRQLTAEIEGEQVTATVEGVVPTAGGSLYAVNAVVENGSGTLLARGAATLALPLGTRTTMVVPRAALVTQGDLTGVHLRRDGSSLLRWVKVGPASADSVEIVSGLHAGDIVIVPGR
jgi:RND family efflux transporter MFP subunit